MRQFKHSKKMFFAENNLRRMIEMKSFKKITIEQKHPGKRDG